MDEIYKQTLELKIRNTLAMLKDGKLERLRKTFYDKKYISLQEEYKNTYGREYIPNYDMEVKNDRRI